MGCGIDAKIFFDSIDHVPAYLTKNIASQQQNAARHPLPRTFTSFQIDQHPVQFQPFKAPEVNEEFYKLSGTQKLGYQRFLDVVQAKFIHVRVKELAEYVFSCKSFSDRASYCTSYSFVTKPISREEYVQIQYVMHHWKIVQLYPILALFLIADVLHQYAITYQELLKAFQAHFGSTENVFIRNFQISKKQLHHKGTIEFKALLAKIAEISELFPEQNPFQDESCYSDTLMRALDSDMNFPLVSTLTRLEPLAVGVCSKETSAE
ncbi:hypothetical protein SS50377_27908 [Spironucleus salmonicida]|uniref:Uncharacterized protein n=1 Tax=Spironucleus salmonicida TaxID=348837 RepID=V6LDB0_9EUKA|nr:hypothetical protein SS50377_27908 [Spironucleus salmonicida]|eukprot:EST42467.1 Hypothetical protein SS50377_17773 [Spironucleus salmonicida]